MTITRRTNTVPQTPISRTTADRPPTYDTTRTRPGGILRTSLRNHRRSRPAGGYPEIKPDETIQVIAFLDNCFAAYYEHWVDAPKGERKTYLCLNHPTDDQFIGGYEPGRACPLCEASDDKRPSYKALFNVVRLGTPSMTPEVAVLPANFTIAGLAADADESERTGPLTRLDIYYLLSRTKLDDKRWSFKLEPIKERDVREDFPSLRPLTPEERAELTQDRYTESVVRRDTYEDLAELVERLYD